MNDEKLYAVKNAKGLYLSMSDDTHYRWREGWREGQVAVTHSQRIAHDLCTEHGGHVVALVEEPEKVVITKEQAKIVDDAHGYMWPAKYITENTGNSNGLEELLMNAYVNGYTVVKEKKYNVKVPHAEGWHFQKYSRESKRGSRNDWKPFPVKDIDSNMSKDLFLFTEAEIEHYGLQDCEKEEVTDDDD